jgi:hypothetical protein
MHQADEPSRQRQETEIHQQIRENAGSISRAKSGTSHGQSSLTLADRLVFVCLAEYVDLMPGFEKCIDLTPDPLVKWEEPLSNNADACHTVL